MSQLKGHYFSVLTDGSGDGSKVDSRATLGRLYAVELIDGDYDNNVDITVSVINTQSGVDKSLLVAANWDSDKTLYPRTLQHGDTDGAALTGTAGGDRALPVVDGTLKVTIAQGGAAHTGGCIVYVLEG